MHACKLLHIQPMSTTWARCLFRLIFILCARTLALRWPDLHPPSTATGSKTRGQCMDRLFRAALCRSSTHPYLKGQVFHKKTGPIGLLIFVAAPSLDPHTHLAAKPVSTSIREQNNQHPNDTNITAQTKSLVHRHYTRRTKTRAS